MTPGLRKLVLTAHVTCSVGWLGAIVAFLPLAVAGLTSRDAETVRAAYLAMELLGRYALVPLALASLATGLVQGLGSKWGVFRHYWVLVKLVINVFATVVLLSYLQTLGSLASLAAEASSGDELDAVRSPSPALHAAGALLLLLVATVLAVYKPPGMTRYGQRRQRRQRVREAGLG